MTESVRDHRRDTARLLFYPAFILSGFYFIRLLFYTELDLGSCD